MSERLLLAREEVAMNGNEPLECSIEDLRLPKPGVFGHFFQCFRHFDLKLELDLYRGTLQNIVIFHRFDTLRRNRTLVNPMLKGLPHPSAVSNIYTPVGLI